VTRYRDSLRKLRDDEAGIGLVEIMVTMVILAIVLTLITGMFMSTSRVVATGTSVNTSTKAASLGLNELSRAIRFAASNPVSGQALDDPAFVVAKSDLLTVTSYIDVDPSNPKPTKLAFTIDSQRRLIEVRYDSYEVSSGFWAFKSTPASTRILTGALIAPSGSDPQLFTYLDSNNAALTMPGTGLTSAQLPLVAAVQIYFKLKSDDATTGNPVAFQSVVGIPNLGINRTGQ
jgi:hypothetical protein